MTVRAFMADDITGINKLLNNELEKEVSADELNATVSDMMGDENYRIFVAEHNNEIVGFIGVHFGVAFENKGKVMRIIALAVKESYQHQGIGTELLEAAEKCAAQNEASVIGVNSGLQRVNAHSFYEKQKFVKKGYSFTKNIELAE
ncbi:MAG: GNAT family N-acetyltransferase [Clostridia bacterium]|nr:GNAT family N-acetyltransferase [Clostridia bacterium]